MDTIPPFATALLPFVFLFAASSIRLVIPNHLPKAVLLYGALPLVVVPALATGLMAPIAVAAIAILLVTAAGSGDTPWRNQPSWATWVFGTALLLVSAALMLHIAPGFDNLLLFEDLQLSLRSQPFDLYWNLDKGLVGFAFLLYVVPTQRLGHVLPVSLLWSGIIGLALAVVLLPMAMMGDLLAWEPKLPDVFIWWALTNLLITSVAEEAVFRGFIQERLSRYLEKRLRFGAHLALLAAGVLFGLAHFAGGHIYVALATVAGIGYGMAYRYGGGILAAVLTHFLFNTAHFLFFTYPLLAL